MRSVFASYVLIGLKGGGAFRTERVTGPQSKVPAHYELSKQYGTVYRLESVLCGYIHTQVTAFTVRSLSPNGVDSHAPCRPRCAAGSSACGSRPVASILRTAAFSYPAAARGSSTSKRCRGTTSARPACGVARDGGTCVGPRMQVGRSNVRPCCRSVVCSRQRHIRAHRHG